MTLQLIYNIICWKYRGADKRESSVHLNGIIKRFSTSTSDSFSKWEGSGKGLLKLTKAIYEKFWWLGRF